MKRIIITTASNMSDTTYSYVCDGFRRKFGEEADFTRIEDDSIIGGFIANVSGEIFDLSISSQLRKMEKHISG